MPTAKQLKDNYDYMAKSKANYDLQGNRDEKYKIAFWQYATSNNLLPTQDKMSPVLKAEYDKYVGGAKIYGGTIEQKMYQPSAEEQDPMSDKYNPNARAFAYNSLKDNKGLDYYERLQMNPNRNQMSQAPTPIAPKKVISGRQLEDYSNAPIQPLVKTPITSPRMLNKKFADTPLDKKLGAGMLGFVDNASMGLVPALVNKTANDNVLNELAQNKQDHKIAYIAGSIAGSMIPGVGIEGAVGKGLAKAGITATTKLGKVALNAGKGALAGGIQQGAQTTIEGRPEDAIKEAMLAAGLGAIADVGIRYISSKLMNRIAKEGMTDATKAEIKREVGQFVIDSEGKVFKEGKFIRQLNKGGGIDSVGDGVKTVDEFGRVQGKQPQKLIGSQKTDKIIPMTESEIKTSQNKLQNSIQPRFNQASQSTTFASDGKINIGSYVKAGDRNNYGKVVGYNKETNQYMVTFKSKDGVTATKSFNANMLESRNKKISLKETAQPTTQPLKPPVLTSKTTLEPLKPLSNANVLSKVETPVKPPNKIMSGLESAYTKTVNTQHELSKLNKTEIGTKSPKVMASNARNSGSTVDHIVNKELVGKDGKPLGKSLQEVLGVDKGKETLYDDYLKHKHNIQRMDQGKPVFGDDVTKADSMAKVAELESLHPEFKQKSDNLNNWFKSFSREWGNDLVGKDMYDVLEKIYPNYVPTWRETLAQGGGFKSKGVTPGQIIKSAVGGDKKIVPLEKSIPALVSKMVKASRKNEAYLSLFDSIGDGNKLVKLAEAKKGEAELIKDAIQNEGIDGIASRNMLEVDPMKGYFVTAMKDGKPLRMEVTKEIFTALKSLDNVDMSDTKAVFGWIKKNPVGLFKAFVTGYNPIFGTLNAIRDFSTAYIQGTTHNPIKFIQNYADAFTKMKNGDPIYKEYIALGGKGGNFFNVEKGLNQGGRGKLIKEKLGAYNNSTETLPRFGEYLGTIKRVGNTYDGKMQALFNAAEVTVNFSRNGNIIKDIDTVVPFLNASTQGLDRFARTMADPKKIIKAFGVSTAPAMILYGINQMVAKEDYDQLDNRIKDMNFLIPLGNGKFFKIPKSREYGILFGSFFERLAREAQGKSESFKGFGNTVATNIGPTDPVENNIIAPFAINLPRNKDFANRPIIPEYMLDDKRSPSLQYDEKTTEVAKALGKALNQSPKQIDYLARSYLGIIATIGQPLTTKNGNVLQNTLQRPFVADSLYNNDILNDLYRKRDELQRIKTDKNIKQNINSKIVTTEERKYIEFNKIVSEVSDIKKQINKLQQSDDPMKDDKIKQLQAQALDKAKKALDKQN